MRLLRPGFLAPGLTLGVVWAGLGLVLAATAVRGEEADAQGTTITGVVRDPEGEPISYALLQIEGWRYRGVTMPWRATDAHGRFEIKNVPEGALKLRAVAGDSSMFSRAGKVVETRGGVRDLVVVLDTGRELRLKVEAYDHRVYGAGSGARLIWGTEPGAVIRDYRWAPMAEDGSVRFVQLPDAPSFEVWGRVSVDRPFKASGLVPSKEVKVIRPVSGLTITGRIVPANVVEDDPITYARAYGGFTVSEGVVKPDGTFVLRGLPEGEYTVVGEKRRKGRDGPPVPWKTVRAGATDVVLDFSTSVR